MNLFLRSSGMMMIKLGMLGEHLIQVAIDRNSIFKTLVMKTMIKNKLGVI